MDFIRGDGRGLFELRPIKISYDVYGYADASVLFEIGNTKVLAAITLQPTVPPFLKGQRVGWLFAEYAMLPYATQQRTQRESSIMQRNARSVEISRLIGRSLRTTVDFEKIGERSIVVDCDVLQADGGTRVACVTAASLALKLAITRWAEAKVIDNAEILKSGIAAISVGVVQGQICVDLNYEEDKDAEADFNFVITNVGDLVEVQGTCEKKPINTERFDILKNAAANAIQQIFAECKKTSFPSQKYVRIPSMLNDKRNAPNCNYPQQKSCGMFSLGKRINRAS